MSAAGAGLVTKKKSGVKPAEGEAANPFGGFARKGIIFTLRGSDAYKKWLEGMAEHDATDLSELAERAFGSYARQIGYGEPRPRR